MGVFYFPCNFVYWRKVPNHEKYKKIYLEAIEKNKDAFSEHGLVSNGKSTYILDEEDVMSKKLLDENKDMIREIIWDTLDELIFMLNSRENTSKYVINKSYIDKMWLSMYDENSTVSMHHHNSSNIPAINGTWFRTSFVAVYIINDPNEKNTTSFMQPSALNSSIDGVGDIFFNTSDIDEIGEGSVLVFPATLHHEVKQMKLPGRIIASFNIMSHII